MSKPKNGDALIKAMEKAIFSIDTCGDITGYDCAWLITSSRAFEKHLATVHPEGEHR